MILDKQLVFSSEQAVTTAAATASTNVVDTVVAGRAINELWLEIVVHTTVTSDGAATVAFKLETDSAEAFSGASTLFSVAAIAKASLTAGTVVARVRIPAGAKRYLRVVITPAVADLTAGKFNAYLTSLPQLHTIGA